tara:strand:- start:191 stop:895 length:705 start_codon:yes stop_codon:yes gene_type:complete
MRYELKRNTKGMITQCETNADGGNIYARREEINKQALENLERPTPGKLGNLSNLQIFNFALDPGFTSTGTDVVFEQYNTTETTGNVTDCIMFNVDSINSKASFYNLVDLKTSVFKSPINKISLLEDSYIEFYLLENIEGSTTSLGRKIPRRAPVNGTSSGTVTWTTTGAEEEYQYIKLNLTSDNINVPTQLKGLRCSGIALKEISLNFADVENVTTINFNFQAFVDLSSVSNSY